MTIHAEHWASMWGLPVMAAEERLVINLADGQLCLWEMPERVARGALEVIERGGSKPMVFDSMPGRVAILGRATTWLTEHDSIQLAAIDASCHDRGVIRLPDPGSADWRAYPLRDRLPNVSAVFCAIIASALVLSRSTW